MLYVRELKRQLAEACETLSTQPSRRLSHARARAKSNLDEVHAYAISRTRQVRATIVAAQAAIATAARTDVRQVRREMTDAIKVVESTSQEHLHRTKENARALLNEVIAMGPQKSLRRGFTIVRDAEGRPVTRAQVIKAKDELHIEFQDGIVSAITQSSIPKE
jgi:exodeoxyribonuclease VII large subunit